MVTKNYARFLNGLDKRDGSGYEVISYRLQNIDGTKKNISGKMGMNQGTFTTLYTSGLFHDASLRTSSMQDESNGTGMFFGSGTAPATSDDYKLENQLEFSDSGLNVISTTYVNTPDDDTLIVYTYVVKNNSDAAITISETGLVSNSNLYNNHVVFLWARDTFEPVTLQPGETRAFTMTIGLE